MSIVQVGSATAEATTITIPTHRAGDLILMFAFRDGSTTEPTTPSGWTRYSAPSGTSTVSIFAYMIATASGTTSGTWKSATGLICAVYRGNFSVNANMRPIGTINSAAGTASSVTYNSLNLIDGSNTASVVVAFVGHRSTNVSTSTAPTGLTLVNSLTGSTNNLAVFDSNGGVNGFTGSAVAVGGTASGWITTLVEISEHIYEYRSSTTFTPLTGATQVLASLWGAGGSGAGGGASLGGGGGGGGAFSRGTTSVTPGTPYTISIGAGGAAAASGGNGNTGGDTYFNTSGTVMAKGGSGGTAGGAGGAGGAAASGVGTTKFSGGAGGAVSTSTSGGGGGGAAGSGSNGSNGANGVTTNPSTGGAAGTGTFNGSDGGFMASGSVANPPKAYSFIASSQVNRMFTFSNTYSDAIGGSTAGSSAANKVGAASGGGVALIVSIGDPGYSPPTGRFFFF